MLNYRLRAGAYSVRKLLGLIPEVDLAKRYPDFVVGVGTYGDLIVLSKGQAKLRVGSYTSIASNVRVFLGGEHRPDWVTTYPFNVLVASASSITGHPASKGDVEIGSDVWIGADAMILSGVRIGDGAVIGAGSVVAKDVPPYAIAAGNPARIIRYRFDAVVIERLLALKWWEWDAGRIEKALPEILSADVQHFLNRYERTGDHE